jgi:hypothetical protein
MPEESEGYEVSFAEIMGDWIITHKEWKGSVLHRTILADRYGTEEAANKAIETMENPS